MLSESLPTSRIPQPLVAAILFSLFLHTFVVLLFRLPKQDSPQTRLVVSLREPTRELPIPNEAAVPSQIVSPSATSDLTLPASNTTQRSEKESRVAKEQIKRGDGPTSAKMTRPEAQVHHPERTAPTPQPKPQSKSNNPTNPQLHLSTDRLESIGQLAVTPKQMEQKDSLARAVRGDFSRSKSEADRVKTLDSYQPFSHNSLSKLLSTKPGDADYLPDIPDGDITMLNAKADHFAVFVRRVALQVFGALRRKSWSTLPLSEASRAHSFTVIEATLSPEGKLLKVVVTDSSGSQGFDKVVRSAAEEGAWDQNPPPEAKAADGNFHFVFKARTWARFIPNAAQEQRWILLGTALL